MFPSKRITVKKSTIKTKNKQQKSEKNCLRSKKEHKNVAKEGTQEQKDNYFLNVITVWAQKTQSTHHSEWIETAK